MFDTIPGPYKLINPDYLSDNDEDMEDANAKNKKKQ